MTIEYLSESGTATIEAGDVEIELTLHSGGPASLDLIDRHGNSVRVLRLSSTRVVVTHLRETLRVLAKPERDEFPPDTIIELSFRTSVENRTSQVFAPQTDISGLDEIALAELTPRGGQATLIRALTIDAVKVDPHMPPLAAAATRSARRLQSKGAIPRSMHGLAVCLDTSASMLVHRRSGVLQALVELALGSDRGMGDGGDVPVFATGRTSRAIEPITSRNAATYVADLDDRVEPTTGFRPSALIGTPGLDDRERIILVLTDAFPSDAAACAERWRSHPYARWRLVIIGPGPTPAQRALPPDTAVIDPGLTADSLLTDAGAKERLGQLVRQLVGAR